MIRRNFLRNIFHFIFAFILGFTVKVEGGNMVLQRVNSAVFKGKDRNFVYDELTILAKKSGEIENKIENSNLIVPLSLLEVTNPAEQLSNFFKNSCNKRIIFPFAKKIILEKQLILSGMKNCDIDFNEVDFTAPDNCRWSSITISGESIGKNMLVICDGENIKTRNIKLNGNKTNNRLTEQNIIGLQIFNVDGFKNYDFTAVEVNYHAIVIDDNSKGVKFFNTTKFVNCGDYRKGASDIFISNLPSDDFYFQDVISTRIPEGINHGQIFYVNGYNGYIQSLKGINVASPFDSRTGEHYIDNIYIDGCSVGMIVQSYPNAGADDKPSLTVKNLKAINISPKSTTGGSLLFISSCKKANFENVHLEAKPGTKTAWHVLRVIRSDSGTSINYPEKVYFKRLYGRGINSSGISISSLDHDIILENVDIAGTGQNAWAFRVLTNGMGKMIIRNYKSSGFAYGDFGGELEKIIVENTYLSVGTTKQRPVGISNRQTVTYYDTDLGKVIYGNGESWKDSTGADV
ncbi:hypothetical protein [Peribacillus butanolivorans]